MATDKEPEPSGGLEPGKVERTCAKCGQAMVKVGRMWECGNLHTEPADKPEWHKVQVFGMYLWRIPKDLDVGRLDSFPTEGCDLIANVPGDGKESAKAVQDWALANVGRRKGRFAAGIARGNCFDLEVFER